MGKQLWKPGNMLYPLPVVMVSLADRDGRPNIITLAWVGTVCPIPASEVKAPMIKESPVNIECKVRQILPLGSHDMFLADVVAVHADEKYMDEKHKFHLEQAEPIIYSHGSYFGCGELLGTFGYSVKKR